MKTIFRKNYFLILALLPFIATFLFLQISIPTWDDSVQNVLFYTVFLYGIAIILLWLYNNHFFLFEKDKWLRNMITVVGCGVVLLWTYKHKITFRLDILLLFLCALYGILHRDFVKPTAITIMFFIFIVLRIIGLFWTEHFDYGVRILFEEESIIFFLLVLIILLGFSASQKQQMSFIAICFKGFLVLLVANVVFYAFAIKAEGSSFFSFITLNKGYFPYYEKLLFWSKFKHPSFISWIILVIGGLGSLLWRKDKKMINTPELITYAVLVFCFVLMVQARIVIISWFIVVMFFSYLLIERRLSKRVKYSLFVIFGLIAIGFLWYLMHMSYFSDTSRIKMYTEALEAVKRGNIWIGNGSGYQRYIMDGFVYYIHNDFMATLVDTGILGLSIFVIWLGSVVYSRDIFKQYLLVVFLPIMNTDVLFYVFECTYILMPLMIFIMFAPRFKSLQP